jgi:hypothetical protein
MSEPTDFTANQL